MNTNQMSMSSRLVNIIYYPLSYVYKKNHLKESTISTDDDYEIINLPSKNEENNLEILNNDMNEFLDYVNQEKNKKSIVDTSNIIVPEVIVPEVIVPEVIVPEVIVPEVIVPEVIVPEVSVPEVSVPEVSVPEVSVPEVSVPEVSVPEVSVPEVSVPEVSVPEVIVPKKTNDIDRILLVNNNTTPNNKDDIKFFYFDQTTKKYQEYNIYVNDDDIDYDKVIKFDENKLKELKTIVESDETIIEEAIINDKENIEKKYTLDDEIDKFLDKLINLFS
jgi:hypothetical protein